jgi:hypothetical protein
VLAAAAAAVSFTAQYRMVDATRRLPAIAALEAAIPDAAALVFACLGIALALHGRRALRARTLNLASVAASVFMNAIAAEPGPATCGSGCTCGCTPARASPTSSACGCAGAASRRYAARAGSARRSRCATG